MKVSLWLIPEPIIFKEFQKQISSLAKQYYDHHLPTFIPHVTLVGGHEIASYEDSLTLLKTLQDAFTDFGPVSCQFQTSKDPDDDNNNEILTMYYQKGKTNNNNNYNNNNYNNDDDNDTIVQWNQSCIQILDRTESFIRAVKLANQVMKPTSNNSHSSWFKPVSCEPHFSWAYTDQKIDTSPFIKPYSGNFLCDSIVLMKTSPSSLHGMSQWKPIGSPISLI